LPADSAASHTEPSLISPSPITTNTRLSRFCIHAASAIPTPIEKPVPERTGRSFDTGHLAMFGVAAEDRSLPAEGLEHVHREIAFVGQHRV